jgi:hypothetical protein
VKGKQLKGSGCWRNGGFCWMAGRDGTKAAGAASEMSCAPQLLCKSGMTTVLCLFSGSVAARCFTQRDKRPERSVG